MATNETSAARPEGEAPAEFVTQVTEALRRLYDPSGLLRSPLAAVLLPAEALPKRGGHALRAVLLEAVESLNPGPDLPFRSLAARSYQALNLHYVQGHTIDEVARYLAISMRQTYRDLRKGEADLATLLWQRCRPEPSLGAADPDPSLRQEVERSPRRPANVSLLQALRSSGASLATLSEEAGARLHLMVSPDRVVRSDATGLRQCLTALLSYVVQAGAKAVTVEAIDGGETVTLRFVGEGAAGAGPASLLATAEALAGAIGARLSLAAAPGQVTIDLSLARAASTVVLVIDDNAGLAELFRRYLSNSANCTVVGACEPEEALRLAVECAPSAIVLDIIMPGADGWTLLGQLKANPATMDVPVLVCSVFRDPQLARSLGAAAFISKPVSQASLIGALAALGLV
jgi:CheY-like chemotaxis protein